jgi:hypothetical protein
VCNTDETDARQAVVCLLFTDAHIASGGYLMLTAFRSMSITARNSTITYHKSIYENENQTIFQSCQLHTIRFMKIFSLSSSSTRALSVMYSHVRNKVCDPFSLTSVGTLFNGSEIFMTLSY